MFGLAVFEQSADSRRLAQQLMIPLRIIAIGFEGQPSASDRTNPLDKSRDLHQQIGLRHQEIPFLSLAQARAAVRHHASGLESTARCTLMAATRAAND